MCMVVEICEWPRISMMVRGWTPPAMRNVAHEVVDPTTVWERVPVAWYGGTTRSVELASGTAVWYHSAKPVVPIRWVLIRDPEGKFAPQALLSTDQDLAAQQIVAWFVQRWQLEGTFEDWMSPAQDDVVIIPKARFDRLTDTLAYAA
jgi:hypothetical protein